MLPASDLLLFSLLTPFSFSSRKDVCFSAGSITVFYIIENSAFFVRIVPPDFFSLRKRYAWFSVLPVPHFLILQRILYFSSKFLWLLSPGVVCATVLLLYKTCHVFLWNCCDTGLLFDEEKMCIFQSMLPVLRFLLLQRILHLFVRILLTLRLLFLKKRYMLDSFTFAMALTASVNSVFFWQNSCDNKLLFFEKRCVFASQYRLCYGCYHFRVLFVFVRILDTGLSFPGEKTCPW